MNKGKLFCLIAMTLATNVVFASGSQETNGTSTGKAYKVGIAKIIAHPALDSAEQGIQDYLATTDLNITYNRQNANGEISTATDIAQQFKDMGTDVSVGLGTPTAQALANAMKTKPLVFSAVTDPKSAGLEGKYICGVSDANPVSAQIELLEQVTKAKTIGCIYNSSEANGVVLKDLAEEACLKNGIEFVSASVINSAEVKMAAQSIIQRVDAIYLANDNAVVSAAASISAVCKTNKKALLIADPGAAEGLDYLIAWGFNYYNIGYKTGELVEQCLKGATPGDIGSIVLQDPSDFEMVLNLDTAQDLGITFSPDVLAMAAATVENGIKTEK